MSSLELTEWMLFSQLEPFGSEVNFMGHAITASTIANVNRGKGDKPYNVSDFMPKFEAHEQTVDEMLQIAQMMTVGLGGKDLRAEAERSAMDELMREDEEWNYG